MEQRRHEGYCRYKSPKGHRHAGNRAGFYARSGHYVHVQPREHFVLKGHGTSRCDEQSVDGVRVYAVR